MADGIKCGHRMELSMSSEQSTFSLLLTRFLSKTSNRSLQWRIYTVNLWTCHPYPLQRPNSFNFLQFLGKFGKIVCWRHPAPFRRLTPPPRGNPGSATAQASIKRSILQLQSNCKNMANWASFSQEDDVTKRKTGIPENRTSIHFNISYTLVQTSSGGHRSGWYASYWNAFLLDLIINSI